MESLEHVTEASTWNSGGGQVLDLLTLKDGRVLVVSDDAVVLYESLAALESGDHHERQTIYLA